MALKSILDFASDILKPYIDNVKNALSNEVTLRETLGAKNFLLAGGTTRVENDVQFTANSDGSIKANGTASGAIYYIISSFKLPKGSYKFTGLSTNITTLSMILTNMTTSSNVAELNYQNSEKTFTLNDDAVIRAMIYMSSGTVVSNLTFYPMIRLASDSDTTYQPYAMTNQQLTEKLIPLCAVPFDLDNANESLASTSSLYSLTSGNSYQNVLQYTATDELFGVATMAVNFVDEASTGARAVKFRIYRSGSNYRDVYETMIVPTTISGEYQNVVFSLPIHLASGDIIMAYALQNSGNTTRVSASINFRGIHKS